MCHRKHRFFRHMGEQVLCPYLRFLSRILLSCGFAGSIVGRNSADGFFSDYCRFFLVIEWLLSLWVLSRASRRARSELASILLTWPPLLFCGFHFRPSRKMDSVFIAWLQCPDCLPLCFRPPFFELRKRKRGRNRTTKARRKRKTEKTRNNKITKNVRRKNGNK